jgi:cysteine synthase
MNNDINLYKYKNLTILRDDKLIGGSKSRFIKDLLDMNKKGFIYCSLGYGAFQVALSQICKEIGKECIIFSPDKKNKDINSKLVIENGGTVNFIPYGYMSVLNKRARDYNDYHNNQYQILTFGADSEEAIDSISKTMKQIITILNYEPQHIYCSVGSGTLLKGILKATEKSIIHGVIVGKDFTIQHERVKLIKYPKKFNYLSKLEIDFQSNKNYDRKALEIALEDNIENSFFWNVN